ncbi:unnamed protein product [Closterium sp. NIES-54]
MTGFKLLKRVFAAMTDEDDQGVTLHRDGPADDSDSEDGVNLDDMLGYMQHLKQQGVMLGKKKKKKQARMKDLLAQGDNIAGPSNSPTNEVAPTSAAEPTPATMTAVAPTAVIDRAAPTVPSPLTASDGTAAVATTAVSTAGPASTEPTPAVTNPVAVSAPTDVLAVDEATANADTSAVTASAADDATRGSIAGRIFPWLYLFRVAVVPAEQAVAQETFRLQGQLDDLRTTLRRTQERERELLNLLSERDAELAALNQRCAEAIRLNEQLLQDLSAAQGTALICAPRPASPSFNMERIPRDANGALIIPALVSHDNHFGKMATEAITYLMLDAPARSMQFYPEWAEFREVICMKYEAAGVSSEVFYYVISNDSNKETLAMWKVSERRSNVNADAKVYGRGPGGCIPESKWHILAEENVAPSISRTPAEWCRFYEHPVYGPGANWHFCATSNRPFANLAFQLTLLRGLASKRATMLHVKIPTVGYILNVVEWPLVNARGRQNPSLDTAEAVNRQNVAHKIDKVVAWIAATYNTGDVAIWDSRPPGGFNMGPRIKILVEGYEREIFPNGTPPYKS